VGHHDNSRTNEQIKVKTGNMMKKRGTTLWRWHTANLKKHGVFALAGAKIVARLSKICQGELTLAAHRDRVVAGGEEFDYLGIGQCWTNTYLSQQGKVMRCCPFAQPG
jgi:hypothetical protein